MNIIIFLLALLFITTPSLGQELHYEAKGEVSLEFGAEEEKEELATDSGTVYKGMPKGALYKIFQKHDREFKHKILAYEWIVFKNWTTEEPNDLITFYLKDGHVMGWKKEFDPTPKHKGSFYEYDEGERIDNWFFPKEKARWDGRALNMLEWHMLTNSQKTKFIVEYADLMEKEYNTDINIDIEKYVIAMNHIADTCSEQGLDIVGTNVVKDLLIDDGQISAEE